MATPRAKLLQAAVVMALAFAVFKYAIRPPIPFSLLSIYMAITTMAVLLYVSSDSDSWRSFVRPIRATLVEPGRRSLRLLLGVLIPLGVGYYAFSQAQAKVEAPVELRAIHPAPPPTISFRGKTVDLQVTDTPVRKDVANRDKHLRAGGAIYIRNCMYCHGDNLDGKGHFAHGFNPAPIDFTDPGTIAQLSEGFLFWRIAKGGPGLPKESTPWNSAMPAWENRLSEEEIWQVIYYLYETTGRPPRRMDAAHASTPRDRHDARRAIHDGLHAALGPRAAHAQATDDLGKRVYEKRCALCHGESGKGDGPAAELLSPRPRDFTSGVYKIRTTDGDLPSDADLVRIVTEGMPGTSMPAWAVLPESERRAVVAYIKQWSGAFKDAKAEPATLPKEVASSEASVARGQKLFAELLECNKCHGQAGRGDPAPGSDLKDEWGQPIRPANLTQPWTFRGGASRQDIAMRLWTGIKGTPMPSFRGAVEDYKKFLEDEAKEKKDDSQVKAWKDASIWDVVNFLDSVAPPRARGGDGRWASLLQISPAPGEVPGDPNADFWRGVAAARFPLVGQVIEDPRAFNPTVDMVTVRGVYTAEEIAFHLTWDDPTPSTPGGSGAGASLPDMLAIQLPTGQGEGERPYFLMGSGSRPVYLLTWQAGSGVGEAIGAGVGVITPQAGESVQAKGQAVYDAGQYRLVIRRPRTTGDKDDFVFPVTGFFPIGFWAWDGSAGESGPKAAISTWYHVHLEPPPSQRHVIMPIFAVLGTVLAEFGLVRWVGRQSRQEGV
jgi:DMSO reductase family type II enzyme heme b subunit